MVPTWTRSSSRSPRCVYRRASDSTRGSCRSISRVRASRSPPLTQVAFIVEFTLEIFDLIYKVMGSERRRGVLLLWEVYPHETMPNVRTMHLNGTNLARLGALHAVGLAVLALA